MFNIYFFRNKARLFLKNPDGSFHEMHYEIGQFLPDIPVARLQKILYQMLDKISEGVDTCFYIHDSGTFSELCS